MIGTGVFTSLGFQLQDIQNTWSILALWVLGGVMAIIGAFCYAEIGSTYRKSGGEYVFLSKLYHPIVGYLSDGSHLQLVLQHRLPWQQWPWVPTWAMYSR